MADLTATEQRSHRKAGRFLRGQVARRRAAEHRRVFSAVPGAGRRASRNITGANLAGTARIARRRGPIQAISRAAAAAPSEIGDFTIIREIGRGGMGVVYEAMQQSLGRHVVLKVLAAPALLHPSHLERFHSGGPRRRAAAPHAHRASIRRG